MKKPICVISGPTASGKTSTSLSLCRRFPQAQIVNFDSLLFYKELDIGTAKPSPEELEEVAHHMVNIRSAKNPLNAADYEREALPIINSLHQKNKIPVLTGGSGFYLQALLYGMFDSKNVDETTRTRSEELYKAQGIAPFIEILRENDPGSYERYHENDHYRIRRAVEHFWTTGTKFAEERQSMMAQREKTSNMAKLGWEVFHIHLDLPKDQHFEIIQRRTKEMLSEGLVEEVQNLLEEGFSGKEKPLQSIGYKETISFLKGEMDLAQAEERINISTRQLAKAQRTWFKKIEKNQYHPLEDQNIILQDFESFLKRL